jgi:hypothetical protein
MRLTLRTLLAWLDGVLSADEQQQLGAKVSSSATASQLVEHIRAAVGRTTIGAPKPDGRGLTEDPNSVAEYLDNTLISEQLESFERICIESEVHLAEVAACHGLLAEVSRDPAVLQRLNEDERQRMHQRLLGLLSGLQDRSATEQSLAVRTGDGLRESRETARAIRQAMDATQNGDSAVAAGGTAVMIRDPERLPAQLASRSSWAAWTAALVALGLLVALAGLLAWSLGWPLSGRGSGRGGSRPPEVAGAAGQDPVPPAMPAASPAPDVAATPVQADESPVAEPANSPLAESKPTAAIQPSAGSDAATPPPVTPVPLAGGTPVEAQAPAEGVPPVPMVPPVPPVAAAIAVAPATAAVVPPAAGPVPARKEEPQDPVGFVGGEGVLLRLTGDAEATEWMFFPVGSPLEKEEDLLVPPTCQPELHVRGVTIRLLPETRAILSLDVDGTPRIEVVFGRAVARASRAEARLGITAAGLMGTVDAGLLTPVAVEVELERHPGDDPVQTPPLIRSKILAASRGLAWRQTAAGGLPVERPLEGIDAQGMLAAGTALEWQSKSPNRVALERNRGLPTWIESGVRPDRLEKSAGEALAAKIAATTSVSRALREMATDKRAENRILAASTLALIGEFDDLVEQLSAESPGKKLEPRQWSQLQDAAVPLALARGGDAATRLYQSFVSRAPHGKADALWAMARGFTGADLAAGADRALVEALDDPSLVVRRYAIKSLIDVTQPAAVDRARYRPDGLPDMRREGVLWWRGQLEKGLVGQPTAAAGGPTPAVDVPTAPPDEE